MAGLRSVSGGGEGEGADPQRGAQEGAGWVGACSQVGTISANGEREIGDLIARAMEKVRRCICICMHACMHNCAQHRMAVMAEVAVRR